MLERLPSEVRVRLGLMLGMQLILALLANRIFDRFVWPYILVTIVASGAVVITERLRPIVRLVSIAVALGVVTALCSWWSDGPLINLQLASGVRQLYTTEWPSPGTPEAVAIVGLGLGVIDALATYGTLRRNLHLTPLLPIALGAIGATSLSAPSGPDWVAWIAGTALAVLFAIVHHGSSMRTRVSAIASERSLVASVALLAIAGVIGMMAAPSAERSDPRQLRDPPISAIVLDPIEATIAMRNSEPYVDLFMLENRSSLSGPSMPSFWRTTAMTEYDGQRWQAKSALRPIGRRLANVPEGERLTRAPLAYAVTPMTDRIDLLPFPGRPLTVSVDVNTDVDRVVVQLRGRPVPNQTIEANALIQPNRRDIGNNRVVTRAVDDLAATFTDYASEIAGEGTDIAKLTAIETTMREQWALDPANPGSGQQFALLNRFIRETRRGTREQFATAFVLLARSLGYDSRVATGFIVPPEQDGATIVLDTSQAAVWPEVMVEDLGWTRFDPTPARIADRTDEAEPPRQARSPAAPQPPINPPQEQIDRDDSPPPPTTNDSRRFETLRQIAVSVLAYSSIILAPLVIAVGGVLGYKAMRRWRRLRVEDPATRIRGAWANSTDAFVDAGMDIPVSSTNLQIAETARPLAPSTPDDLDRLAQLSTAVTFGNTPTDDKAAEDATEMSRSVKSAIGENLGWWQRWRWRLSLRSIRPGTRSPVVP